MEFPPWPLALDRLYCQVANIMLGLKSWTMQVSWGLLCFRPPGLPGGGGEYEQFPSGSDSYGTFRGKRFLVLPCRLQQRVFCL